MTRKLSFNNDWREVQSLRAAFVNQAERTWIPALSQDGAPRNLISEIAGTVDRLLDAIIDAEKSVPEITPAAQVDLGDHTKSVDIANWLTQVRADLPAITAETQRLWDAGASQPFSMTTAPDGQVVFADITMTAAETATLLGLIQTASAKQLTISGLAAGTGRM